METQQRIAKIVGRFLKSSSLYAEAREKFYHHLLIHLQILLHSLMEQQGWNFDLICSFFFLFCLQSHQNIKGLTAYD